MAEGGGGVSSPFFLQRQLLSLLYNPHVDCCYLLAGFTHRVLFLGGLGEGFGDGDQTGQRVDVEEGQHILWSHQGESDVVLRKYMLLMKIHDEK